MHDAGGFSERGINRGRTWFESHRFERNASVAFVVKGDTIAILRILARRMDGPSDRTEQ